MTARPHPVDVFAYLDYRRFLADVYRHKKSEGRGFSYRSFARRAGVASPNHLKRVVDGDRNLSEKSAGAYAKALGLDGEVAAYFRTLVRFNQSRTREQREAAYERMRSFRGYREAHRIDASYADYHAHWFVPAVREMALRTDFRADADWIATRLVPAITGHEAQLALDTLFRLGMLTRGDDGTVVQTDPVVSTGEQTRGLHITRYHEAMMDRAKASIALVPADERYVASLTFCVGPEGFERVRQRVQRFRQELISLLAEETDGDQVLQLGVQLFPLTTSRDGETDS